MLDSKKISVVIGTRPEAIKMAPLIKALRSSRAELSIVSTGQHEGLMQPILELFGIVPDVNLAVMRRCHGLSEVFGTLVRELPRVFDNIQPDYVLVHGDTATAAAASTACFLNRIKIGHVEAGLRSNDMEQPWPEEFNRRLIDLVADLYFAPTPKAKAALLREGVVGEKIEVTGNTVVDALLTVARRIRTDGALHQDLERRFGAYTQSGRMVLVTSHRRENFGAGLKNICGSLLEIAQNPRVRIVWPLHLNPQVRAQVYTTLGCAPNVHLIEPVGYLEFTYLMMMSTVILTDSGGIQEEAPSLGKQLIIMRDVTERPEVVEHGLAVLAGTDSRVIVDETLRALECSFDFNSVGFNPFGDGTASEQIVARLARELAGDKVEINPIAKSAIRIEAAAVAVDGRTSAAA